MLKKLNNQFHKKAFFKYDHDVKSLGWGSLSSQDSRFQVMTEIGIKSGDSVLDLGCGFGDFYRYLQSRKLHIDYIGVDINDDFINKAVEVKKTSAENCSFIKGDILCVHSRKFDWVVASGIFSFSCSSWNNEVCNTVKEMFEVCTRGVSVNFLSAYSPHETKRGFQYVKPEDVIQMLVPAVSSKFVVRHDYRENDFTLYFYK